MFVADGSTALPDTPGRASLWSCVQGGIAWGWGDLGVVIHEATPAGGCQFMGSADNYLTNIGGHADCWWQLDPSVQMICLTCSPTSGAFDFPLYSSWGTFSGDVIKIPDMISAPPGTWVRATLNTWDAYDRYTDANGHYTFTQPTLGGNPWGVPVFRPTGVNSGPGFGTYSIWTPGMSAPGVVRTTFSSHDEPVDLYVFSDEPAQCTQQASQITPPIDFVGQPISCVDGNVFFSHEDAVLKGLGGDLAFTRRYNSATRGPGQYGVFGPGWFHPFESRIEALRTGVVRVRGASGRPRYFSDLDGDGHFEAAIPYSLQEWLDRQPDGSYRLGYRDGRLETYDTSGRLTAITDATGNTTALGYASGQLTTITAPSGRSLTLGYTGGRPTTLTGPSGLIATYAYVGDFLDTVTYADAAAGGYKFTYSSGTALLLKVEDLSGKPIETHGYDGNGWGTTSEIADGQERYTLEYLGASTRVTDALGNVTTYDLDYIWGAKRVTKITGPCAGCGGGGESRSWTYDDRGRIVSYTDADGKVTTYTYDAATGDLLQALETKDTLTRQTTYTYDGAGRVLTVSAPDQGTTTYTQSPAGPTSILGPVHPATTLTYTTRGQLETITNGRQKVTRMAYDPTTGDLTSTTDPLQHATTFGYDAMGRRNRVTDPVNNATTYAYDVLGRPTRITYPDTKSVSFTYDKGGRRLTVTDPLNRVTTYGYDAYGRLSTVTDAATPAGVTRYGYDTMSRLESITDARGKVTSFHYDPYSRVDQVTYPGTPSPLETFTYYPSGRLHTRVDRKGVTTTFTYDALGRLSGKSYSDGTPAVTFGYDLADRLLSASNGTDDLTWTYNDGGEVLSEASARNGSSVTYEYDEDGNRYRVTLDGLVMVTYAYDDADRLTTITRGSSSLAFGYDNASRRTSLQFPNNVSTSYGYDTKSRLTSVATTGLDSRGRRVTLTSSTYTYDAADNRLTKGGDFAESYTYDPLYRLTQVKRGSKVSESYAYDAVGNRLSALNSSPWTYDDRNELQSYPGVTFQYDANGNTTQKVDATGTWTYEWNAENQLTRVLKNGTEQARYAYDPKGRRVEKVAGTTSAAYLYDGTTVLKETKGAVVTTYIQGLGIDEPLAREDGAGTRTYYHADGLGSLVKETSSAGAVALTKKYDAFGNLQLSAATNGFAFTGREWDSEVGHYYYRARYYDPKTGRFLSEDPIRFLAGPNFYAYVESNPTTIVDPYGLLGLGWGPAWDIWTWFVKWDYGIRRPGHDRFPGDENSFVRHCAISCESARSEGETVTRTMGLGNEAQGFIQIDIGQIMRGRPATAAVPADLIANEAGITCSRTPDIPCETLCRNPAFVFGLP